MPRLRLIRTAFIMASMLLIDSSSHCCYSHRSSFAGESSKVVSEFESDILPILKSNCYDCHSAGTYEGNVRLDPDDQGEWLANIKLWQSVLKNVRAELMPPHSSGKLDDASKQILSDWIKTEVFRDDLQHPSPGYVPPRRLNRTEYRNTIRDLMGVDFNAEVVFPPDDTGFGFDNVGESLSISPMLLDKYIQSAKAIVDEAVPKATLSVRTRRWNGNDFQDADRSRNAMHLRIEKPITLRREFRIDEPGEYQLKINEKLHGSFDYSPIRYHARIALDGTTLYEADYKWEEGKEVKHETEHLFEVGDHYIEVEISQIDRTGSEGLPRETDDAFVAYQVASAIVEGPKDQSRWVHPSGYERFFDREAPPQNEPERSEYARHVLERFTTRAFRGPASKTSLDRLNSIAVATYQQPGETFETGIGKAVTAALASPRFLFKTDSVDSTIDSFGSADIDEYSLASRLSYFLWSTMPDQELMKLAEQQQLRANLESQVTRMLLDDRSKAFSRNFVGQWLRTRDVENVSIDAVSAMGHQKELEALRKQLFGRMRRVPGEQPTGDEEKARKRLKELSQWRDYIDFNVRAAMRQETEMGFEYLVRENRSLLEILDADYVFVNEKLARVYGMEGIKGQEMRRVTLPENARRGGILTQGTLLVVTSNPTRTSPVKRGLFVLDNLLGTPAPPPPAIVPALEDAADRFEGRTPSLRELLAAHREAPLCSSCHSRMDPLGLALENYNAFGLYRDRDNDNEIDAAGELITGESFQNVEELKKILVTSRRKDFYRCITEKLMVYALGRGLDYHDENTVDSIVEKLDAQNGRSRVLINAVIQSAPFQKQRRSNSANVAVVSGEARN